MNGVVLRMIGHVKRGITPSYSETSSEWTFDPAYTAVAIHSCNLRQESCELLQDSSSHTEAQSLNRFPHHSVPCRQPNELRTGGLHIDAVPVPDLKLRLHLQAVLIIRRHDVNVALYHVAALFLSVSSTMQASIGMLGRLCPMVSTTYPQSRETTFLLHFFVSSRGCRTYDKLRVLGSSVRNLPTQNVHCRGTWATFGGPAARAAASKMREGALQGPASLSCRCFPIWNSLLKLSSHQPPAATPPSSRSQPPRT